MTQHDTKRKSYDAERVGIGQKTTLTDTSTTHNRLEQDNTTLNDTSTTQNGLEQETKRP